MAWIFARWSNCPQKLPVHSPANAPKRWTPTSPPPPWSIATSPRISHHKPGRKDDSMLKELRQAEAALPKLLARPEIWKTLLINYRPPLVERLYTDWNGIRLSLHCIHEC